MKYAQKNNTSNNNRSLDQSYQMDKNHLYNLLYAGRITLKEYLQKVKTIELEPADA